MTLKGRGGAIVSLLAATIFWAGERLTGRAGLGVAVALVGVLLVLSNGNFPGPGQGRPYSWEPPHGRCHRDMDRLHHHGAPGAGNPADHLHRPPGERRHRRPWPNSRGDPHARAARHLPTCRVPRLHRGVPSVLSYLLSNRALAVVPAARAGVFLNLITVYTAAFTVLTGGSFTAAKLIGGLVVLAGVLMTNGPRLRAPKSPTSAPAPEGLGSPSA